MPTVVIYDTKFGNTARIAEAIAHGAGASGSVSVLDVGEALEWSTERPDLLIVGGPTQRRGPSPAMRAFADALPPFLRGIAAATFDTRYRGATWLMGSAAVEVARRLDRAGARLAAPPESFFIARGGSLENQSLEPGELERAEAWGRWVVAATTGRGLAS